MLCIESSLLLNAAGIMLACSAIISLPTLLYAFWITGFRPKKQTDGNKLMIGLGAIFCAIFFVGAFLAGVVNVVLLFLEKLAC